MASNHEPHKSSESSSSDPAGDPGLGDLLRNLVEDTRRLVRDEIDMARAELHDKARHALRQSLIMTLGAGLIMIAFVLLMSAITFGLANALTPLVGWQAALWVSPLVIALTAGFSGGWLLWRAVARLKAEGLTPRRTIESLRETSKLVTDRLP